MDAVKFLKAEHRMFKQDGRRGIGCFTRECDDCPLQDSEGYCLIGDFEKRVKAVENWIKEHPAKTYKQDFLEKYPNAPLKEDNIPKFCLCNVGYLPIENQPCMIGECGSCLECWNRSME